ncbi:MAG: hypothetical protein ACXWC9_11645 [Pseudobdellovibrionaceae bacterium]
MKNVFLIVMITLSWSFPSEAATSCRSAHRPPVALEAGHAILEILSRPASENPVILQNRFDHRIRALGGGACATVNAANFLQILKRMSGHKDLLDLDAVVENAFATIPALLEGRVTNAQMNQLLNHFQIYFPNRSLQVREEQPKNPSTLLEEKFGLNWGRRQKDFLLASRPGELKILILKVVDPSGKVLGRHFVILREPESENSVSVVDPNRPFNKYVYSVVAAKSPETKRRTLQLHRTGFDSAKDRTLILDTVFTASLAFP